MTDTDGKFVGLSAFEFTDEQIEEMRHYHLMETYEEAPKERAALVNWFIKQAIENEWIRMHDREVRRDNS